MCITRPIITNATISSNNKVFFAVIVMVIFVSTNVDMMTTSVTLLGCQRFAGASITVRNKATSPFVGLSKRGTIPILVRAPPGSHKPFVVTPTLTL